MRKKEIIWILVLVVLAAVYVRYFGHWFEKRQIAITASVRPNRRTKPPSVMIAFTLNDAFKITSLKVVPLDHDKYNPEAMPVWSLVSDSNSVPTRIFRYGQPIRGMKPALKGVHADPLTPGQDYRLILSTTDANGFKDFRMAVLPD